MMCADVMSYPQVDFSLTVGGGRLGRMNEGEGE